VRVELGDLVVERFVAASENAHRQA